MLNFIKAVLRFFQKDNSPKVVITEEAKKPKEEVIIGKKKIAIIVGHGHGDGGAETWNGSNEYNYNFFVSQKIKDSIQDKHIQVFLRDSSGIVGACKRVESWNPEVSIELHLNSFNKKAHGCEVLCLVGDVKSATLAMSFSKSFCSKFTRTLRGSQGVKWIDRSERGGLSLRNLSKVKQKILVESFFCDNPDEWIEPEIYANFLIDWINGL